MCEDHVGLQRDQFFRECLRLCTGRRKASVDADIAAFRPSTLFQPLPECREASLGFRIVLGERHEHADAPHSLALLRARRYWPRSRAAKQRYELTPPQDEHATTSQWADHGIPSLQYPPRAARQTPAHILPIS